MNQGSVSVRRATQNDAEAIRGLYQQLVSNPAVSVSSAHLARLSTSEHHFVLVAEQEGTVKGTALISLCEDIMFQEQPFAVVENVVVDRNARSRGIGLALFREIETLCKRADCSKVMLSSSVERTEAHKFFEKMGFASASKVAFVKYRRSFK